MITEKFPFLLPLRVWQRKLFFYIGMRLDGNSYAKTMVGERLSRLLYSADSELYNADTGFDMVYQENKVFNLKLLAKKLDGLLIGPGETFSFWQAARHADKHTAYKDGLVLKNGNLTVSKGGGLCQMSNLLFWVFLHSPLTIIERHTHRIKAFPTLRSAEPEGVDATVSEGWLDLKMRNDTGITFQIGVEFDDERMTVRLFTSKIVEQNYEIEGRDLRYYRKNGQVYEKISIYRSGSLLYTNLRKVGYDIDEEICNQA